MLVSGPSFLAHGAIVIAAGTAAAHIARIAGIVLAAGTDRAVDIAAGSLLAFHLPSGATG